MVATKVEQAAFDILLRDEHILQIDNEPRFPELGALSPSKFAICCVKVYSERVGEWCWMGYSYSRKALEDTEPAELANLLRSMISFQLPLHEDERLGGKRAN